MDDVTNNLNNVGKPIPQRKLTVSFTPKELSVVVALAQNPHVNYQDNEELMAIAKSIFEDGNRMLDYHIARDKVLSVDNGLKF